MTSTAKFLDERRLLYGPWQAFERDIARLLLSRGFDDVRLIGGAGDQGCDVLGSRRGELWVVQCKHTTSSAPQSAAIAEVVEAGKAYGADRLAIAVSRPPGDGFLSEVARHSRMGLAISILDPRTLLDEMQKASEYPATRRQLHDYQLDATSRFREALTDTGRAQAVLATGLGKTVIMAEVVASLMRDGLVGEGRVLVLAHTRPLVAQLHRAFWYQLPTWVATHQLAEGERPVYWEGITFATIQSAIARLDTLPRFGLVLIDEAHHAGAEVFQRTVSALDPPMLGGVTATPWRGDGYDISGLLGQPVVRIGIAEGLRRGFLSEVDYRLFADNIDWSVVQDLSRHRYSLGELNRRLILPTRDEEAARTIREVFLAEHRRSALVFSPTIHHAETFAVMLRRFGFRVEAISSRADARQREALMSRFRGGAIDVLTTVDLFNEGVDVPDVDLIVFMRATHSRRIFVQQLGRGLRVSAGKDRVVVLDFVTDLRRMAEVLDLDRSIRTNDIEHLGLGSHLIQFSDRSAGGFLREWMLDQADLMLREDDPTLELPRLNFPVPQAPGSVQ